MRNKLFRFKWMAGFLIPVLMMLLIGCSTGPQHYTMADFATVQKIDAHVHVNSVDPAFIDQAKADNFRLLTINTDYSDYPPVRKQQEIAMADLKAYPDRIAYSSTFL
ncbi:MAG: hypothetical protein P8184_09935, partial [Calditrichia bacterium]